MPRLNTIDPQKAHGRAKELFDGPLKNQQHNIFRAMANSPAALDAYVQQREALSRGVLTAKEREIIALTVGQINSCEYCVAAHTAVGQQVGLSEAETIAARTGELTDPRLAALVRFVSALNERRGFVTDGELDEMRSVGYEDAHLVEICAVFGMGMFTNLVNHVNHTELDFPPAPKLP